MNEAMTQGRKIWFFADMFQWAFMQPSWKPKLPKFRVVAMDLTTGEQRYAQVSFTKTGAQHKAALLNSGYGTEEYLAPEH